MDNLDPLTDVMAQIATEQAALSKLCFIKERLENEVVAKKELARAQGVKRKQEKHRQLQKKQYRIQIPIVEVCQTFTMAQT